MSSLRTEVRFAVRGMTCENCQKRIEAALKETPGVLSAAVSLKKGQAEAVYEKDRITEGEIIRVIGRLGYAAERMRDRAPFPRRELGLLLLILFLYLFTDRMGMLNLFAPSQLAEKNMSYAVLFMIGLLSSVHCIAMCGGINLSQCLPRETAVFSGSVQPVPRTSFAPAVSYNFGRVLSYTAAGAALGAAGMMAGGGSTEIPTGMQGLLKLFAGIIMVIMGINMLGILPWLRAFRLPALRFPARMIHKSRASARGPFVIGILNGLMPCGPLQAMQIAALVSGSPLRGALSMLFFSLGTVPLMLGFGSAVSLLGHRFTRQIMTAGAVLVTVLGLAMAAQGVSLGGSLDMQHLGFLYFVLTSAAMISILPMIRKPLRILACVLLLSAGGMRIFMMSGTAANVPAPAAPEEISSVPAAGGTVQEIRSTLSARQYPAIIVQKGVPVRWIIDAPEGSINGCNYKMLLRPFGQTVSLQEGENIIEFTPSESGSFDYSCWMGMVYGNVTVVE